MGNNVFFINVFVYMLLRNNTQRQMSDRILEGKSS